jgi:putative flippase GtrA
MKKTVVRYIIVGGLSAAVEMGLLVLFVEMIGVAPFAANILAFCLVNTFTYLASRLWVFESTGSKKGKEAFVFLSCLTCGLLLSQFVFWLLTGSFEVDYRLAKIVSIGFIAAWNFLTRKFIVFSNAPSVVRR